MWVVNLYSYNHTNFDIEFRVIIIMQILNTPRNEKLLVFVILDT